MDSADAPHAGDVQRDRSPDISAEGWWLAEVFCWTVVVLAPFLRWVNGPAVSTDQLVVRIAVVCLALAGGIALRTRAIVRAMKRRRCPPQSGSA